MFQFEEEMLGTQIGKPSLDMAKPSLDMALMHMCILLTGRHPPLQLEVHISAPGDARLYRLFYQRKYAYYQ